MSLILLSEYKERTRSAKVYKWANGLGYEVYCLENDIKVKHDFNSESQADDFAEDWVLAAPPIAKTRKRP